MLPAGRPQVLAAQGATGETAALLAEITTAFGVTPAVFRVVAHSPAALRMMWGAFTALGSGRLDARLGEQIAVAVADRNRCEYCLAAHTALGRKAGASSAEVREAQLGRSQDPRTAAALAFAHELVENRGQVRDEDVEALRAAGFDDEEVVEVVAHVALNLFTNYLNVGLAVPLDFPAVRLSATR